VTAAFVRCETSTVNADESAEAESATATATVATVTKPVDRIQPSVSVTSKLSQETLMSNDVDTHQSTLGRFLIVNKLFVLLLLDRDDAHFSEASEPR